MQRDEKKKVMAQFASNDKDTGSTEVQIAIFTAKIENLKNHLKEHGKDNHSRRGIMLMVAKRRKLLNYLKKKNPESYQNVLKELNLRK
ncbi:MAG: 30S ribosomal protein S15 [Candidatus Gracilibacteria bacterium]|jgi:small subunit ribosomal protein S15|nr:30S ribosomal protein S15 [Candidatus Gracilibacteria bacterium]